MAEIPEDVILEILSFLPLKLLVRIKHLNKRLHQSISSPIFQYRRAILRSFTTTGYEYLFHKVPPPTYSTFLRIGLPSPHSRGLGDHSSGEKSYSHVLIKCGYNQIPVILASSGGLLLLHLFIIRRKNVWLPPSRRRIFCLFNPATEAYQIIQPYHNSNPFVVHEFSGVGLVVSRNRSSSSSDKLVLVITNRCKNSDTTNCEFFIYEFESKRWHRTCCNLEAFTILSEHQEAYYLNDSLYWLTLYKNNIEPKILTFNVKTEVAEQINLPEASNEVRSLHISTECTNFCAIRDRDEHELAVITGELNNNKAFLHTYDFIHRRWKIDRIFESLTTPIPVFCDGNRLISFRLLNGGEGCIEEIRGNSNYNIVTLPKSRFYWRIFKHFSGALTEIPNCQYLVNGLKGMKDHNPDDDEFQLKWHFEDLLFIAHCCSFSE